MRKSHALMAAAAFVLAGCSTSTHVKLPADATVRFDGRFESFTQGDVKRRPFFWTTAGGIPYKVEKNGAVMSEGKLNSRFRPASIFWPPYALIYWPMGFGEKCYDLTGTKPASCDTGYSRVK